MQARTKKALTPAQLIKIDKYKEENRKKMKELEIDKKVKGLI